MNGISSATLSISETLDNEQFASITTRGAFYKKRSALEKWLLVLLVLAAILLVGLIIALSLVTYYYSERSSNITVCDSPECVRAAANLIASMDTRVDPCEDFYMFACGRWPEEHPIPDTAVSNDWFSDRTYHLIREIREFLKKKGSPQEPKPVTQARIMFAACMDQDELDAQGLEPMFDALRYIGLPTRPPLTSLNGTSSLNWAKAAARAKRFMYQDLLIGFDVYPRPSNRTAYRLTIGTPETRSPFPEYRDIENQIDERRRRRTTQDHQDQDEERNFYIGAYLEYVAEVLLYIDLWPNNDNTTLTKERDVAIKTAALEIHKFDTKLTKIMNWNKHPEDNIQDVELSVDELQQLTDAATSNGTFQWNWTEYLTLMFEGVQNVSLDLENRDKVVVTSKEYLIAAMKYFSEIPSSTIELALWWEVVHVLAPETNRKLREIKERYIEKLSGGQSPKPRATFCANMVNSMMGMAVSTFIADPQVLNSTKLKVEEMLQNIQWTFTSLVRSLDWMDEATKEATKEKVHAMKRLIGFPEWILDKAALEKNYEGLEVSESEYLWNMIRLLQLAMYESLANLRAKNPDLQWITGATVVNAYYTFDMNAISVPAGILQFPFYDLGLEALNYGALGNILGHELTHGFDNSGRQYNKEGNLKQWWSNETVEEYLNKTACFIKQYSSYWVKDANFWVDGRLTLGENIADNGGLHQSLRAYRRFVERNGPEPSLPGLENFSHEQLYFISFANVWCESPTKQSLLWNSEDSHSPHHIRVRGALANSPEFARAWNCPEGSGMNPVHDKCHIW